MPQIRGWKDWNMILISCISVQLISLPLLPEVYAVKNNNPKLPYFVLSMYSISLLSDLHTIRTCVFVLRLCCSMAPSLRRTRMDLWALEKTALTLNNSWYSPPFPPSNSRKQHLLATLCEVSVWALLLWWWCAVITPLESSYCTAKLNLSDLLACCHAGRLPLHALRHFFIL